MTRWLERAKKRDQLTDLTDLTYLNTPEGHEAGIKSVKSVKSATLRGKSEVPTEVARSQFEKCTKEANVIFGHLTGKPNTACWHCGSPAEPLLPFLTHADEPAHFWVHHQCRMPFLSALDAEVARTQALSDFDKQTAQPGFPIAKTNGEA